MGLVDRTTESLALDTNIFVYAYQKFGSRALASLQLLEKINDGGTRCFISVLVFEEFLVKIYKEKLDKKVGAYEEFLTGEGTITVVDVDRAIARLAAKIRAEHPSLRAPDAIHLASAIQVGADTFITTDKRLPRKVGKLTVKILS